MLTLHRLGCLRHGKTEWTDVSTFFIIFAVVMSIIAVSVAYLALIIAVKTSENNRAHRAEVLRRINATKVWDRSTKTWPDGT